MSIQVMSAVWELDLPRDQKLILMAFADHANDDGFTFPSLARIAWKCGYEQPRSVSAIVKKLLESQVLVLIEKAHGRTPTLYQIRPYNIRALPPFDPKAFKDRDAQNAPQDDRGDRKSLNTHGSISPNTGRPAENAPLSAESSVGVRSDVVGVRSSARRGAVATTPEPLNRLQNQDARARAPDEAGALTREQDRKLKLLRHRAAVAGVYPPTESEVTDLIAGGRAAERRIEDAETRRLQERVEQQRREREEEQAREAAA